LGRNNVISKKVVIVHDWLIAGGAEKVVLELHRLFPDAPIYTSYCTPEWRKKLDGKVRTGYLQYLGGIRKFIPFLRILWFSRLKLKGYDLIISSSGAEAKGVRTPKGALHMAYIHAPTHYYWSRYDEYMKNPGFGRLDPLARIGLKLLLKPLRKWDYAAAQKPDVLLANSTHTQEGIKKYYGRDSIVVFPPVDTEKFSASEALKRKGFVITGRQTPYKRVDLAVQACTQLDLPLTVIGNGPDHQKLKAMAGPTVTFKGFVSDDELRKAISEAEAFLFPGIDDFGIAPVEAMAAGTPVIAYKGGGALDYITPQTGLFFEEQTADSLVAALRKFDPKLYSPESIKKAAERFSIENFRASMTTEVQKFYDG
jgi:glycosyltransferase involved in cell wall biosynthesis